MTATDFTDVEFDEGPFAFDSEDWDESGAISIKSGIVTLSADLCVTGFAMTLANPTVTTDDYKRLQIIDTAGAAHTLTPASPFGNGGANEAKATFSGVIGDSIRLMAYQGYWYITGKHQVTVGSA